MTYNYIIFFIFKNIFFFIIFINNINQELAEVREMLTEMKTLIQKDNLKTPVEEKKIDINDLAKDLIEGKISQADFFSNLKLLLNNSRSTVERMLLCKALWW